MSSLYSDVIEVSISAAGFVAVTIPSQTNAKSFLAKARDNSSFLVSNESDGDGYITIPLAFSDTLDNETDATLFYVKGTTSTTLEVLLRRK